MEIHTWHSMLAASLKNYNTVAQNYKNKLTKKTGIHEGKTSSITGTKSVRYVKFGILFECLFRKA